MAKQDIISALQNLLHYELMARDQYFAHSRIYRDWGLNKLADRLNHEMEEETEHADAIIERLLFLGASPNMNSAYPPKVGSEISEMLQLDLDVEYAVGAALKEVMALCEREQDYVTRRILQKLLDDTEMDHAHWLEQQLRLIKMMGKENYLQSQL